MRPKARERALLHVPGHILIRHQLRCRRTYSRNCQVAAKQPTIKAAARLSRSCRTETAPAGGSRDAFPAPKLESPNLIAKKVISQVHIRAGFPQHRDQSCSAISNTRPQL